MAGELRRSKAGLGCRGCRLAFGKLVGAGLDSVSLLWCRWVLVLCVPIIASWSPFTLFLSLFPDEFKCPVKEEIALTSGEWEVLARHGSKVPASPCTLARAQAHRHTLLVPLKTSCACGSPAPLGHSSLLHCPLHSPSMPKAKAGGTLGPGCRALPEHILRAKGAVCYPSSTP